MNVFPGPSSVIIMDNCRIHKPKGVTDMIYERLCPASFILFFQLTQTHRGMRCEFLPPYSPDYSPIELAFSAIKADFQHRLPELECTMMPGVETEVLVTIQESVFSVTSQDAFGWFRRCGYA